MHAKLRTSEVHLHASAAQVIVMQSIVGEELAQGPYVAARIEPATLQTKGDECTDEPPRPT